MRRLFLQFRFVLIAAIMMCSIGASMAAPGGSFTDPCYTATKSDNGPLTHNLKIMNTCIEGSPYVYWAGDLNLSLGVVEDGEVIISKDEIFVDSNLRPDLDVPAQLVFPDSSFATKPIVLVDGSECGSCNVTYLNPRVEVQVPGFSNYTLTGRTDFIVRSDPEPELKDKTFQSIDLGNVYRSTPYACVVQIFGKNQNSQWVLVQTNPQQQVQARMFGSPDTNQPESLGYFPTKNGLANTYFRGDQLTGYSDFTMVIQCADNTNSSLVYEESISTRYSPAGRTLVSRGVWLTDGANAFYVVIFVVGAFLVIVLLRMAWRRLSR